MLAHMKALVLVAAATSAGLFTGVHSFSLSSSCETAVKGLLTSPDAACLNPTAIFSFVLGNQGSIPATINTWLTGICSSGACTNASIVNVVTNLTSGCSAELSSLGVDSTSIQSQVINIAQQVYPSVRQVACLKDDSSNQLCALQTLNNLESVVGQLNMSDLTSLNLYADAQKLFANGAQNIACTNCAKESFSIAKSAFPSIVNQAIPDAQALCGASFVDGSLPDGISQTANNEVFSTAATQQNTGFRVSQTTVGSSGVILGAVFAAFALMG